MTNTMSQMKDLAEGYPSVRGLQIFYRTVLGITRRHGAGKLSRLHVRFFPRGQRIRHPTGAPMIVPGDPHFFGYLVGHENHIARVIRDVVKEGDTCVDVGANIGYFSTMLAGAVGKAGRVICYEPESRNYGILEQNSRLAAQWGFNLIPVRAAVSQNEGTLKLATAGFSTAHHIVDGSDDQAAFESVPAVNLETDLPRRGVSGFVRLLKIDVEGHEVPALQGCSQWLNSQSVGTAIVEVNEGDNARSVERLVAEWGASASYWFDGSWRRQPIGKIPCRTDVRIDFH